MMKRPAWVGLGIEQEHAAAVAQNLRRIGIMLDQFTTRGADPDQARVCRILHRTLDRTATTFEALSVSSGGTQHPALIDVSTVWQDWVEDEEEEEDGRDVWGRFPVSGDYRPHEV